MGVDAEMIIGREAGMNALEIKRVQYGLMHRFGKEIFWTDKYESPEKKSAVDFIQPWKLSDDPEAENGYWPFDAETQDLPQINLWRVRFFCRYYGEDYERGPGLKLACMIRFLIESGFRVWYGGDSSGCQGEEFDLPRAESLLAHFLKVGHLPYQSYTLPGYRDDDNHGPLCSYCQIETKRFGWGGRFASFGCLGCGETQEYRDEAYDKLAETISMRG